MKPKSLVPIGDYVLLAAVLKCEPGCGNLGVTFGPEIRLSPPPRPLQAQNIDSSAEIFAHHL